MPPCPIEDLIDVRNIGLIPGLTCKPLPKCSTGAIDLRNSEIPGVTCIESPEEKPELPPCPIEDDESVDLRSEVLLIPGMECPFIFISG